MSQNPHDVRIADLLSRLRETSDRFASRLEQAGERAQRATSGWTAAQVAAHVAMVNHSLAAVIEGSAAGAAPPPDGFTERDWTEVLREVPARNEAPRRFHPPDAVTTADATQQFRESTAHLAHAIGALAPDRAMHCITNRVVGTITLYQAGDFAIAHMIRHNQQAKRILESV